MYLYENIESEKPKEKLKLDGAKFTRDEDKNKFFELKYRIKKGGSWRTDTFKVQHQDEIIKKVVQIGLSKTPKFCHCRFPH